jgi:enterochelin esterase family protein
LRKLLLLLLSVSLFTVVLPAHSQNIEAPKPAVATSPEPQNLRAGFIQERSLGPGEEHVYLIVLEDGYAVLGEADQHGVDLVIDIVGPDGKLIRTVDSPNGVEGPEPVDLTAFTPGAYKLVIHGLDPKAKPGKYVMKVDRLLTAEENGQRMAERNYPPALQGLWREYVKDPKSVERFVASRKGQGPIQEEVDGDNKDVRVTYLYYGDENTENVRASAGPHGGAGGILMQRFMQTPLFFASEIVPKDARFRYGFVVSEKRFTGRNRTIQVSSDRIAVDSLNPNSFAGLSVLTLADALPQPYIAESDSVPRGKLTTTKLKSTSLSEERALSIYTPPSYDGSQPADLLIVFDGEAYDGGAASTVPTPTILNNLIAAKKIGPTMAVFVNNAGDRKRDLGGSKPFADFIGKELIPWLRSNYRINPGPSHVVVAGSSRGGLAASHCAFVHSEVIGNVLSQSGSYWVRNEGPILPSGITADTGDLVLAFRDNARLPIRFYVEVGRFEAEGSMLGNNREFRDVLLLKGYPLTYRESNSGHDDLWWRGSLADGLIVLLSRESN